MIFNNKIITMKDPTDFFVQAIAKKKNHDLSTVVDELIKSDMKIAELIK